jgi:hypothetical protein
MNLLGIAEKGSIQPIPEARGKEKPRPQPKEVEFITVVFCRTDSNVIQGVVKQDSAKQPAQRTKIVFIFGYKPEKNSTWQGPLPLHEEEWLCHVIQDTLPENPRKGVLKVRLIENLTTKQKIAEEKERHYFAPILQHINILETAREIEKFALQLLNDGLGLKHGFEIIKSFASLNIKYGWDVSGEKAKVMPRHQELVVKIWDNCEGCWQSYVSALAAWLEHLCSVGLREGSGFLHLGKRDFRCNNCHATTRTSKDESQKYVRGEKITIVCEHCGAKCAVQKDS